MTKQDDKNEELKTLIMQNHVEMLKLVADVRVDVATIKGKVYVYGGIIAAAISGAIGFISKVLQQ